MLHAGLDLSRRRLDVWLLDEHGELVAQTAVRQAGFDGDLEARMICPGGSRGSIDGSSEEVPA